ncbi:restriction endonuclease subunit S [Nostoc ellipsosporum NOK]|nr:restriction endonuclease subunit S [Nostoc ellipsosporum NOK]
MSEWKKYRLGNLAEVKGGKRLPKGELLVNYETPHPYIRVTDLGHKWIRKDGLQFVTPKVQKFISRYTVSSGNVILSIVGSIGFVGRVSDELDGANLTENCVKFLTNSDIIDDDYLFYFLKSESGQEQIEKRNVGSTQPKLPLYNIKDIDLTIPLLPAQKAIASILSSLDDKIDLLHRQNATLEKMAETLFRQWFVEEVKEEWENSTLANVIDLVYGKALKEEVRSGTGFPVVGSSGVVGYHSEYLVEGPGIVIGRKGTLGKVIYLFDNFYPIDTTYFIKSKSKSTGLFYEYFLLKTLNFEEMNSDSAVPGLNRDIALSTEIRIAPSKRIIEFNKHCAALFNKLKANQTQIRTLTTLRDTLLPKLMSGEIKVKTKG